MWLVCPHALLSSNLPFNFLKTFRNCYFDQKLLQIKKILKKLQITATNHIIYYALKLTKITLKETKLHQEIIIFTQSLAIISNLWNKISHKISKLKCRNCFVPNPASNFQWVTNKVSHWLSPSKIYDWIALISSLYLCSLVNLSPFSNPPHFGFLSTHPKLTRLLSPQDNLIHGNDCK